LKARKLQITALLIIYLVLGYLGFTYELHYVDGYLHLFYTQGEILKLNTIDVFSMPFIKLSIFTKLININILIISIWIYIQYLISKLLETPIQQLKYIIILLISLATINIIGFFLLNFGSGKANWLGVIIFGNLRYFNHFLYYFPSLPFLMLVYNRGLLKKI
jgi:hypothetical protein